MSLINLLEVLTHKSLKMKTPLSAIYGGDSIFSFSQATVKAVDLVFSRLLQVFALRIRLLNAFDSFVFSGFLMRFNPPDCSYFKSNQS